jgi:hypothetical protein
MSLAPSTAHGTKTVVTTGRRRHKGGFSDVLRARTVDLDAKAESSGIVREMLRGRASRYGYAPLLRNLIPAYERLEHQLEHCRHDPGMRAVALPALYRSRALNSDIRALWGEAWSRSLPLLQAGKRYAQRIATACGYERVRQAAGRSRELSSPIRRAVLTEPSLSILQTPRDKMPARQRTSSAPLARICSYALYFSCALPQRDFPDDRGSRNTSRYASAGSALARACR